MSFPPYSYDNSVHWYHCTYHSLERWINVNKTEDVLPIIEGLEELELVFPDKEEKLYHRMLSLMSLTLGPPSRKHSLDERRRLQIITTLIKANNRGCLIDVMNEIDPDDDSIDTR